MNLQALLFDEPTAAQAAAGATAAGAAAAPEPSFLVHAAGLGHSRAQVQERALRVAEVLADMGLGAGAAVGVMLPDGADVVATLFGVWRAGHVYVPLNPRLSAPEVERTLTAVEPAVVVTTSVHADRFGDLPLLLIGPGAVEVRAGRTSARRHDPDVALIQSTSGTTGPPKAVLLRHSGVLGLIDGVLGKLRAGAGAGAGTPSRAPMPNLIPVSLSLWAGIYNVLFAFRVGAPVVVMDGFDTVEFARLVERFGIRSTVLPPAAMAMLSDDERIDSLAPLRFVRSITAPLSPLQARRFRDRFGISVLNSYGQTEIGGEIIGWNAADSREHGDAKLGSVGRPHDGVQLRTVDAADVVLGVDEPGELWVMTPSLSAGYADGSDLGDRLSPDGWFRTGDVARIDPEGFVWIEGRVSDMINRGGLKVYPAEVQEVVRLAPHVADAAVVGVPDDRLGEVPWAFVVGDGRGVPDLGELAEVCRHHLAPYKVPVRFEIIADLPRNEVGKVLTRELLDRASRVVG